jgi:hypothetical protein
MSLESEQATRPTYEQIRDTLSNKAAREQWRVADLSMRHMRESMQDVHDDESLSLEGKRAAAQRVVDRYAQKISTSYEAARKKAEAAAETSWRFSVPMPGEGKTLATTNINDTTEMIAVQNEPDYGLRWDNERKVWTSSAKEGFAYDGSFARANDAA